MILFRHKYKDIISLENLLEAWCEFLKGKRNKKDVQCFERNLMENLFSLYDDLKNKTYVHGEYTPFKISDPKPRDIHKASVRDRLLHHAIYRILYPYFDRKFIHDSYSCRKNKGTHRAINRFYDFARKVSKNNTKTCWVLKCDIKKFFASIDHEILFNILGKYIRDTDILWLLNQIVFSFNAEGKIGIGLPLGNLTSQLLVNIYMNEFDYFVKRELKLEYYIRYADDFVILSRDRAELRELIPKISNSLQQKLKLNLHPNKVYIKTYSSGVDFLGWVHFSYHRVLRTTTKRRMIKKIIKDEVKPETIQSYLGLLEWGNSYNLEQRILDKKPLLM